MKKITANIFKKIYQPARFSRKGENGVLLIIGGSKKYHGAPWYAIEAASPFVDLIYYYSDPDSRRLMEKIKSKTPAFISIDSNELDEVIRKSDCLLIGPGWGEGIRKKNLLSALLHKYPQKKFVLDADALKMVDKKLLNKNCLVTPHAGEFKILFRVKASPENTAKMAEKYHCLIALKGVKDIICSPEECFYNITGNQGMTKGGTGDVLAGLIAAFACKNNLLIAGRAGLLANGLAGDSLRRKNGSYYNTADLAKELPRLLHILV